MLRREEARSASPRGAERAGSCGVLRVRRDLVPVHLLNRVTARAGIGPVADSLCGEVR